MKMKTITLVVPCYNEEAALAPFIDAILSTQSALPYVFLEVLFVNDGSKDQTLDEMKRLADQYPDRIAYLSFSRNFGKEAAMLAGLAHAQGEWVAPMDVDLQDPPGLLAEMYTMITEEGYDVVVAYRHGRQGEPRMRSYFANRFYRWYNRVAEVPMQEGARDFRLMTRPVVDAILAMPEAQRFSKGIFTWVGFKTAYLAFDHVERTTGETSWSFWGLFEYALEGMLSFSELPINIIFYLGIILSALACLGLIWMGIGALFFHEVFAGWLWLGLLIIWLGSIQVLSLGILGKYVAKIFKQVKQRPHYIIKESHLLS